MVVCILAALAAPDRFSVQPGSALSSPPCWHCVKRRWRSRWGLGEWWRSSQWQGLRRRQSAFVSWGPRHCPLPWPHDSTIGPAVAGFKARRGGPEERIWIVTTSPLANVWFFLFFFVEQERMKGEQKPSRKTGEKEGWIGDPVHNRCFGGNLGRSQSQGFCGTAYSEFFCWTDWNRNGEGSRGHAGVGLQ